MYGIDGTLDAYCGDFLVDPYDWRNYVTTI